MGNAGPGNAAWLAGGGEMGARMRAKDWSASPLGHPETWPESIKTAVSICLNSRFPIALWLGPELRLVYNDTYIPFLGETKHPAMLGAPGREAWGEIWAAIESDACRGGGWKSDLGRRRTAVFHPAAAARRGLCQLGLQPDLCGGRPSRSRAPSMPAPRRPRRSLASGGSRRYAISAAVRRTADCRDRLPGCGRGYARQSARYSVRGNLPA